MTFKRRWIKLYVEILDDPKMGKMPDWLWRLTIELFLLAGENGNDGELQPVGDMAWRLRLEESKLLAALESLSQIGVTELLPNGIWKIKNFTKRQDADSPTERKQLERYRKSHEMGGGNVTKRDTEEKREEEIKEEKRKEGEESRADARPPALPPRPNVFSLYEREIGALTPVIADALRQAEKDYPQEWLALAFQEAATHNARSWKYAEAVLKRWKTEGFKANGKPRSNGGAPGSTSEHERVMGLLRETREVNNG